MNRIIICLVFFTSIIKIQAQDLIIKGDNFIYVDNTVLYVNKGIDLQDKQTNSLDGSMGDDGGTTNGSNIYLRSGAQLIQGDNNYTNRGEGNVSILVGGTANKWSYNFFSSPVGLSDGSGYKLNQLDQPLKKNGDALTNGISSKSINSRDVVFSTSHNNILNNDKLQISSRWLFKKENENWVMINNPEGSKVNNGFGYMSKGLGEKDNDRSFHPYEFRGLPNNGDIEIPLDFIPIEDGDSYSELDDDYLYLLLGNPYPSILDLRKFIADNKNIIESFHFWQAGDDRSHSFGESEGGYATLTVPVDGAYEAEAATFKILKGGGVFGNDGNNDEEKFPKKNPRPLVPIGQGFLVKLHHSEENILNSSKKIVFKNKHRSNKKRVSDNGKWQQNENNGDGDTIETGDFFRPGKDIKDDDKETLLTSLGYSKFRLNLNFNNELDKKLVMTFHDNATDGFDIGLEAKPPMITNNDVFWGTKNNPLIFLANKFDKSLSLPITIDLNTQQYVEINVYDLINIPDNTQIYLHDILTDTYINLRDQNFSINLDKGTYENRFEITFQENSSLNQTDFNVNLFKIISDNKNKRLLVYNPKLKSIKSIKLYDTSGKEVHRLMISKTSNVYEISTSNISNGVFIAKIESTENSSCSKRVIINK